MNLRQQLKFTARGFLRAAKPSPLLFGMAALGIIAILNLLASKVTNQAARLEIVNKAGNLYAQNGNFDQFMNSVQGVQLNMTQTMLDVFISLMITMISVGVVIYVISEARYHKGDFGNLFDGLPVLARVVSYQIVTAVFTALWSMLLVVPGLIAAYSYRQGLYILLDHPEMGIFDCIRASKNMMKGHKMELFWLDFSFFGWTFGQSFILSALTYAVGGESILPSMLVLPLSAFVTMYMEFTMFLYYEHLHGVHYDSRVPNTEAGENDITETPLQFAEAFLCLVQ